MDPKMRYEHRPYMTSFAFGPKPDPVVPQEIDGRRYVIHEGDDSELPEEIIERFRTKVEDDTAQLIETGQFSHGNFKQHLSRAKRTAPNEDAETLYAARKPRRSLWGFWAWAIGVALMVVGGLALGTGFMYWNWIMAAGGTVAHTAGWLITRRFNRRRGA